MNKKDEEKNQKISNKEKKEWLISKKKENMDSSKAKLKYM